MKNILTLLFVLNTLYCNAQWVQNYNTNGGELYDIRFTSANTGFAVGLQAAAKRFVKTTNGGINWSISSIPYLTPAIIKTSFINDYTGWVSGNDYLYGIMLKTTNQGQSWDSTRVLLGSSLTDLQFINSNTGWTLADMMTGMGTGYRILKSTNGGLNWTIQLTITSNNIELYNLFFINANIGYVTGRDTTTKNALIYKTTNSGINWNQIILGTEFRCDKIFFVNENTGYTISVAGNISKTTNGGYNWTSLVVPNWQISPVTVFFLNANTGYVAGFNYIISSGFIKRTSNGGINWVEQTESSFFPISSIYFVNALTGWAVGWSNIYKTTNGGSTYINQINSDIPVEYKLSQNFPNPFNPATNINFSIPKSSHVKITVFDLTGKEVIILINDKLQAGSYQTFWNGSGAPSGIYFYKLSADGYTETRKMILVK